MPEQGSSRAGGMQGKIFGMMGKVMEDKLAKKFGGVRTFTIRHTVNCSFACILCGECLKRRVSRVSIAYAHKGTASVRKCTVQSVMIEVMCR